MKRSISSSLVVDAFELRLADINTVELDQLHTLSIGVGWPHRSEDWQFLRDVGHGIVALDEIGRVLGSAMWFPHGSDFATVGMVITSPRLQTLGIGQWLMKRIMAECQGRRLRLNATRAARHLYLSLNFRPRRLCSSAKAKRASPRNCAAFQKVPNCVVLRKLTLGCSAS
jgi:GNAT superfamily N-acetyltransferase